MGQVGVVGERCDGLGLPFVDLLPAALLAALTVVSTLSDGRALTVDARVVGLLVAGLALWRRAPFVVVILLASAATALVRLVN